jgi:hypothetical protein
MSAFFYSTFYYNLLFVLNGKQKSIFRDGSIGGKSSWKKQLHYTVIFYTVWSDLIDISRSKLETAQLRTQEKNEEKEEEKNEKSELYSLKNNNNEQENKCV